MARGPQSEDPEVPEWMLGIGALFGWNRIQTRWKLLAVFRKYKSFRRELEPASRRFENQICGECGALQPGEALKCSSCGQKLASPAGRFLKSVGLSFPTFLSVSSLLGMAFIVVYFRMLVEWPGQGFMGWEPEALLTHGGLWPPAFFHGQWWRIGTANFVHIGVWHVFFNMTALTQIGPAIEDVFGRGRMVFFFFASGVIAMFASAVLQPHTPTAGASGAVMGLIGVAAGWGQRSKTSHGRAVRDQMLKWAVYTTLFGLLLNANHVAHGAGFLVGGIAGYAFPTQTLKKTQGSVASMVMGIVGGLGCAVLVLLTLVPPASAREEAERHRRPKHFELGEGRSERAFRAGATKACRLLEEGDPEAAVAALAEVADDGVTVKSVEATCRFISEMKGNCAAYREGGLDAALTPDERADAAYVRVVADYYRLWCSSED